MEFEIFDQSVKVKLFVFYHININLQKVLGDILQTRWFFGNAKISTKINLIKVSEAAEVNEAA